MQTTAHITPSEPRTARELLAETVPLAEAIPGYGPPVALAVPGLLFVLALAGPFALVFTFVAVLVAVALLVALAGAILASPYLLVRHLRKRWAARAPIASPAVGLAQIKTPRAAA
jgi:hypothetical protein